MTLVWPDESERMVRERARMIAMLCDRRPGRLVSPRGVELPVAGSGWSMSAILRVLALIDLLPELMPESRGAT